MPGTMQYIRKFGNVSFCDMPFGDADNVALCEVTYMPFEKVVSESFTDEPRPFDEVCRAMFSYNGNRHRALGLMIKKGISVKMMEMSKQKRFSEMKIVACTETFKSNPAVQFAAATFILPDGNLVVSFRGTDDSLIGWKEDIDLFVRNTIPSHALAVEYIENVAKHFEGGITIIGHSKGGNVSLFAALNCSEETRSRIKAVYNNDGPGFYDNSPYRTKQYQDLLPRYNHFIPSSSFVGVLLAFDKDYTVVKSNRILGPTQHDLGTWQIADSDLKTLPHPSKLAKINEICLSGILYRINSDQKNNFERIATAIIEGSGQRDLIGVSKHIPSVVKNTVETWKNLDEDSKKELKDTFSGSSNIIKDTVKLVVLEDDEKAREHALEGLASQRVKVEALEI